jgi:hypothetical protein
MDPITIATGAVSMLIPYLANKGETIIKKVGKEKWKKLKEKTKSIFSAIKDKFEGNEYAVQTLKRMEEKPEDEGRQSAMKDVLMEILTEDEKFQKILSQLLNDAKQTGGDKFIQVYGSGAIAIGDGVAAGEGGYAAGRDIIIGNSRQDKQ